MKETTNKVTRGMSRIGAAQHHVGGGKVPMDDVRLVHLRDLSSDGGHERIY